MKPVIISFAAILLATLLLAAVPLIGYPAYAQVQKGRAQRPLSP
jgi:hypothetical protein